jgi:hypothetical protein
LTRISKDELLILQAAVHKNGYLERRIEKLRKRQDKNEDSDPCVKTKQRETLHFKMNDCVGNERAHCEPIDSTILNERVFCRNPLTQNVLFGNTHCDTHDWRI